MQRSYDASYFHCELIKHKRESSKRKAVRLQLEQLSKEEGSDIHSIILICATVLLIHVHNLYVQHMYMKDKSSRLDISNRTLKK